MIDESGTTEKYMTENDTMIEVKYNMGCDMNFDMNMYA